MKEEERVSVEGETAELLAKIAAMNGLSEEEQVAKLFDDFCAKGGYLPEEGKGIEVH